MTMYEIHVLMNYPANCLNRDDMGSPKTVVFNGTERIRISSQSLKRAWRTSELFSETFGKIASRTRGLPELVGINMSEKGCSEEMILAAKKVISTDKKRLKDDPDTKQFTMEKMEFYSLDEVSMIADVIIEKYNDDPIAFSNMKYEDISKICKESKVGITMDQAMFGRMVTDETVGKIDAAVQVAHAMSTNAGALESDYFVAVDDLIANGVLDGPSAVGHMNTTDYDSSCFYEHVIIDTDQLKENLKNNDDSLDYVMHVCSEFVKVMAFTSPSARQNTFEAHVVPEAIYVEMKDRKIPVNMCNAFNIPARRNVSEESVKKLANEVDRVKTVYGLDTKHAVWLKTREEYSTPLSKDVTIVNSLQDLICKLNEWADEE